jgi:hypothetical protein
MASALDALAPYDRWNPLGPFISWMSTLRTFPLFRLTAQEKL